MPGPKALIQNETATGWTRILHFCDKRAPHVVQFALERELMVLFTAGMDQHQLTLHAQAFVVGASYSFELRFIAALPNDHYYTLRTDASWTDAGASHHEYYCKSSIGWFDLWTRDLKATQALHSYENVVARYQQECSTALQAQQQLTTVAEVQRTIIEGMKRGGKFGISHKEGGTDIFWGHGRFIRSDYGDDPGGQSYTNEAEFLTMLWNFCQHMVTRHAGKQGLSEMDTWKLILRRMSPIQPRHPDDQGEGDGSLWTSAGFE